MIRLLSLGALVWFGSGQESSEIYLGEGEGDSAHAEIVSKLLTAAHRGETVVSHVLSGVSRGAVGAAMDATISLRLPSAMLSLDHSEVQTVSTPATNSRRTKSKPL